MSRTQIHPNRMLPERTLAERNDDRYCTVVWKWVMWMRMWILDVDLAQSESEAAPEPGLSSPTGSSWSTLMCGGLSVVRSIAGPWSRMPCSAPAHSGLREAEGGQGQAGTMGKSEPSHPTCSTGRSRTRLCACTTLHCARCTWDLDLIGQLYHPSSATFRMVPRLSFLVVITGCLLLRQVGPQSSTTVP